MINNKKSIILHIDFDSFFASVEQQDDPSLRGKPVAVTAANGRNCIIASSREAKILGINTGSRVPDAKRICPNIHLIPANFQKYWNISKKFISICKNYSPVIEVFSIDEIFMDVTETVHLFGGTQKLIDKIKKQISEQIGEYITVSIGVSYNKLLAKLASGLKKPNGCVVITPEQVGSVYKIAKLTDICGIGERIKMRLNSIGIYTLSKLRQTPLNVLVAEFGPVEGQFLYNVGKGVDYRPVISYTQPSEVKSIGRQYCLPHNEYDSQKILQILCELCEEVALKLRRINKKARKVNICLKGANIFVGHTYLPYYTNMGKDIFEGSLDIILENLHYSDNYIFEKQIINLKKTNLQEKLKYILSSLTGYVRQIHVGVYSLENVENLPLPLFLNEQKIERVTRTIDAINKKFGNSTIRKAFLLNTPRLPTVPNGYLADKYERKKLINF